MQSQEINLKELYNYLITQDLFGKEIDRICFFDGIIDKDLLIRCTDNPNTELISNTKQFLIDNNILKVTLDNVNLWYVSLKKKYNCISVNFTYYVGVVVTNRNDQCNGFYGKKVTRKIHILFFDNGDVVYKWTNSMKNFVPVNLRTLSKCKEIQNPLLSAMYVITQNPIWKDFYDCKSLPSINLATVNEYHNKRELLQTLFKIDLPKTVNNKDFVWSYACCCSAPYIKDNQLNQMLQANIKNFDWPYNTRRSRKFIAREALKLYFQKQEWFDYDMADEYIVEDYIDMAMELKEKIDLNIGRSKLYDVHNELADRIALKENKNVKFVIPDTPLKYLKLPKEFVLIRSKKALYLESEVNHNCVKTYLQKIVNGNCVIYTADIDGEHLTIEICLASSKKAKRAKFKVNQCLTTCNQPCKPETYEYVCAAVKVAEQNYQQRVKENKN